METHHITPARGLSETGLKWIALVTMVLDHIHYFFSFTGCVPEWFSMDVSFVVIGMNTMSEQRRASSSTAKA